jgi:hypothetical protein
MKRYLAFLSCVLASTACHSRKAAPTASQPDYEATRTHAEKALAELGPGGAKKSQPAAKSDSAPAPAVETPAPTAKIGEKDDKLGCTWVDADALVSVGGSESRDQVRARAIEQSRDAAMRDLLGVDINQRSLDFQQESLRGQTNLIENVLRTTRRGCLINEKVLTDEFRDLGTCRQCGYYVSLKACIKERPADWDKDFVVELGLSRDRFVDGDEAKVSITSRRDAYIYLYDVGMNSETSSVVPNEQFPQVKLKAGETWTYPNEDAAKQGVHLVAQMPDSHPPISAETTGRRRLSGRRAEAEFFKYRVGGRCGRLHDRPRAR